MRNILAFLTLTFALACGGGSSSSVGGSGSPPPPKTAPVAPATFQGALGPLAPTVAPIGSATPTMLVTDQGIFRYETADFQNAQGALYVDGNGNLQLAGNCTLTHPDGTSEPFTLTGTYANGQITGTCTAGDFSLAVTTLQDIPIDLSAVAGNYVSTSISTGRITYLSLKSDGTFTAADYNSMADYPQFAAGYYTGTLSVIDPVKNALNAGATYLPSGVGHSLPSTWGFAMFDANGDLYLMTSNPNNSTGDMQFSGIFVKQ